MDSFAPEFSQYWLQRAEPPAAPASEPDRAAAARAEAKALEELEERVSAARTIA